ncbi:MAG: ferrochelatase [Acidobacteria bacterium]|nr:ferrochelatase [Acidobacteriota bacterium]
MMREAVLLAAHGAPECAGDVAEYLSYVRGGRPMAPRIVAEVERRYREIGGGSPLLARTREQAAALQAQLGVPVYFGMRNWRPFLQETMARMQSDGIQRIVALCLAPQYSRLSVGFYFRRTQQAKDALGYTAEIAWTKSFHDHPMLVEAFHEKLAAQLPARQVLFTAHSLPERILESGDVYDKEARTTAALVARRAGLHGWEFAYQSQGMTDERWLGPGVESKLDQFAARGIQEVVLHPIGFVSDHVEVLYDVDILFHQHAAERGIALRRPESLNSSPTFIRALADVASQKLSRDRQGAV